MKKRSLTLKELFTIALENYKKKKFTITENITTTKDSKMRIFILNKKYTIKIAKNCPIIAIHLILIRLLNKIVFI